MNDQEFKVHLFDIRFYLRELENMPNKDFAYSIEAREHLEKALYHLARASVLLEPDED